MGVLEPDSGLVVGVVLLPVLGMLEGVVARLG
jgi:hypothetical protein